MAHNYNESFRTEQITVHKYKKVKSLIISCFFLCWYMNRRIANTVVTWQKLMNTVNEVCENNTLLIWKSNWKPLFTTLFIQWSISLLFYLCLWTASAFSGSMYFLRTSLTTVSSETLWYIKLKRWIINL